MLVLRKYIDVLAYYVERGILALLAAAKSLNLTLIPQLCHCSTFAVPCLHTDGMFQRF